MRNHPFFSVGFRSQFLLSAWAAVLIPTFWVSNLFNYTPLPKMIVSNMDWHAHEMFSAFTLTLIGGFLLTASSHWTNKDPFKGVPLIFLTIFWFIERVVFFFEMPRLLFFILSNLYIVWLFILVTGMLYNHTKNRNIFLPILFGYFIAKNALLYGAYTQGHQLMLFSKSLNIHLTLLTIVIVSGRIVPFFTNKKHPELNIKIPTWVNHLAIWPLVILTIPAEYFPSKYLPAFIYLIALLGSAIRLALYRPLKVIKNPILFILHTGYMWIVLYLILRCFEVLSGPNFALRSATFHAFATGALGVFAIGMMNRVSLGHTGRAIEPTKWMIAAYLSVHLGAFIRVFFQLVTPAIYSPSIHHASGWWTLGFCIYLYKFTKILWTPRPDGKPH